MKDNLNPVFLLKDEQGRYVSFFDQFLNKARVITLIFPMLVLFFYYVADLVTKELEAVSAYREQRLPIAVTLWFGIHVIGHFLSFAAGRIRKDIRQRWEICFGCMLILMDILVFFFV